MKFVKTLLLFCLAAFSQTAFAQATLSIQGIIQKSNGAAVDDGKYDLTFKLYPVASGGTAVHSETQNIAVAGGIYSAELGSGSTPLTAAFDQTYYLGVSVDGGAELIPRARLTSSPYSLALLGTSNLFPSSGAIGAGTVTPASGYQFHARNGSGQGKILIAGTQGAVLDFSKENAGSGQIGIQSSDNNFIINSNSNTALQVGGNTKLLVTNDGIRVPAIYNPSAGGALNFYVDGTTRLQANGSGVAMTGDASVTNRMHINSDFDGYNKLKVGGPSFFSGFVEINGSKTYSTSPGAHYNTNGHTGTNIQSWQFSMQVSNTINAASFMAFSDRRIKKDFRLSENMADLSALRKLRVTDYRYIDELEKGAGWKKGFVAQEVGEVFPEAVAIAPNFIPNVYTLSGKVSVAANKMSITVGKNHDFKEGDEVKLILPNEEEKRVFVLATPSENTFVIDWNEPTLDKIFVFGKKVSDFRQVDYDKIFTLNVSATQELARQVEELKRENASLRSELGSTKVDLSRVGQENKELKATTEKFDARLRALENKLSN